MKNLRRFRIRLDVIRNRSGRNHRGRAGDDHASDLLGGKIEFQHSPRLGGIRKYLDRNRVIAHFLLRVERNRSPGSQPSRGGVIALQSHRSGRPPDNLPSANSRSLVEQPRDVIFSDRRMFVNVARRVIFIKSHDQLPIPS
ncbi:hypothetical protein SDC9_96284 [bioreactor metagenome]|uniref:Uncharacterized protein n=1 Tax=bioreactor metagenome TaxID=1076179 RepID=A0A645AIR8_9ZZZZ